MLDVFRVDSNKDLEASVVSAVALLIIDHFSDMDRLFRDCAPRKNCRVPLVYHFCAQQDIR
jgi:hypothetical protein